MLLLITVGGGAVRTTVVVVIVVVVVVVTLLSTRSPRIIGAYISRISFLKFLYFNLTNLGF